MRIPTISIITPLYNAENFVERHLQSVKQQRFTDWEHILINDCSTDKSMEIVRQYAAQDKRIRILENKKNSGPAITRNKGIKAARGRYIAFLDSDDQWYPDKLKTQLHFMREKNIPFSFTYYDQINEKGEPMGVMDNIPDKVDYFSTLKNNKIGCLTTMYDTDYFGKSYMPIIQRRQDYALWLRLLRQTDYAYCIPEILSTYTKRSQSISSNKLKLIKYNWQVYHDIEGHSVIKSVYYLVSTILNRLKRII